MIKFRDILNEGKQVGILYHFKIFNDMVLILKNNCLRNNTSSGLEKYYNKKDFYISFTRNKNFHEIAKIFNLYTSINKNFGCICILVIDGDKLSNNYSIEPVRDESFSSSDPRSKWNKTPKTIKKGKKYFSADESEERIYTNKCIPIKKYINKIILINPKENEIEEIKKYSDLINIEIKYTKKGNLQEIKLSGDNSKPTLIQTGEWTFHDKDDNNMDFFTSSNHEILYMHIEAGLWLRKYFKYLDNNNIIYELDKNDNSYVIIIHNWKNQFNVETNKNLQEIRLLGNSGKPKIFHIHDYEEEWNYFDFSPETYELLNLKKGKNNHLFISFLDLDEKQLYIELDYHRQKNFENALDKLNIKYKFQEHQYSGFDEYIIDTKYFEIISISIEEYNQLSEIKLSGDNSNNKLKLKKTLGVWYAPIDEPKHFYYRYYLDLNAFWVSQDKMKFILPYLNNKNIPYKKTRQGIIINLEHVEII